MLPLSLAARVTSAAALLAVVGVVAAPALGSRTHASATAVTVTATEFHFKFSKASVPQGCVFLHRARPRCGGDEGQPHRQVGPPDWSSRESRREAAFAFRQERGARGASARSTASRASGAFVSATAGKRSVARSTNGCQPSASHATAPHIGQRSGSCLLLAP